MSMLSSLTHFYVVLTMYNCVSFVKDKIKLAKCQRNETECLFIMANYNMKCAPLLCDNTEIKLQQDQPNAICSVQRYTFKKSEGRIE